MLVSYFHVIALTTLSCLAGMIYAKPVAIMQERAPQAEDRPGFVPEVTSLVASLAGDGWNGLLDAIYGDDSASSALAAATSAQAAGEQGKAASYFSQATAAAGENWSKATNAAGGAWSSYTSAYDENNGGDDDWTSEATETGNRKHTSTSSSSRWSAAPTSTRSASFTSSAASSAASDTGSAFSRFTMSALTFCFVALSTVALTF
ncbi:hypothetical protein P389DRAFT_89279 [Cystobasidium minutum MCA 4210]|uniref:uncharacterized protein n=1 Tax=Cystobasidium minutum MCA 4210 TaxID=1397322 RepID=UPI0034CF7C04|eukprot:jgi/Rhomi1/89279/CE89278_1558